MDRYNHAGNRICCLQALMNAAYDKRAVYVPDSYCWTKPTPAAFMINLSGSILNRLLIQGIYIYEKDKKEITNG